MELSIIQIVAAAATFNVVVAVLFVVTLYKMYEINFGLAVFGGVLLAISVVVGEAALGAWMWNLTGIEKMWVAVAGASGGIAGATLGSLFFDPEYSDRSMSEQEKLDQIVEKVEQLDE